MKLMLSVSLLVLATNILAPNVLAAEKTDQSSTSIGIDYAQEKLSIDSPRWHERTLRVQHQFEKRHSAGVELSDIQRFGRHDSRLGVNYSRPLSEQTTATIDAAYSPTHQAIARHMLGAALQIEFAPAWLLHVGGRATRYDGVIVNQALIGVEHYFSSFSWSASLRPAQAFGRTIYSGDVRGSYYYGANNLITLIAATGEEADIVDSAGAVTQVRAISITQVHAVSITQVRAFAITGRHWLDRYWAVRYGASHTRQGDAYSRKGINLGIQYTF